MIFCGIRRPRAIVFPIACTYLLVCVACGNDDSASTFDASADAIADEQFDEHYGHDTDVKGDSSADSGIVRPPDSALDVLDDVSNEALPSDAQDETNPDGEASSDAADSSPDSSKPDLGPCGTAWNRKVDAQFAIEGAWMFGRHTACAWQKVLEDFHRIGGNWVWQFGPEIATAPKEKLETDAPFSTCRYDDKSCAQHAIDDIGSDRIAGFLTYEFGQSYSAAIAACPGLDKQITVDGKRYHRIVLPTSDTQGNCPTSGKVFVLFAVSPDTDSETFLLTAADALDMKVILGMPSMPHKYDSNNNKTWLVEMALMPATKEWSRRVFLDYKERAAKHKSFAGVYQSFEVPVRPTGSDDNWDSYGKLATIFHSFFPDKIYALSPYWLARKQYLQQSTPKDITAGIKRMAMLGVDVIAPQDGRGTSNVGLYWPHQLDAKIKDVDPMLIRFLEQENEKATIEYPPDPTFGDVFTSSISEFFAAAAEGVKQAQAEGAKTKLWTNIESFEPFKTTETGIKCSFLNTAPTTFERVTRAISASAGKAEHVVSYMYDPYFTCKTNEMKTPLLEQIRARHALPIIDTMFRMTSSGKDGFILRGLHVAEASSTFEFTWHDKNNQPKTAKRNATWTDPTWGKTKGMRSYAQEVFVEFSFADVAPESWIHVRAHNAAGAALYQFSVQAP